MCAVLKVLLLTSEEQKQDSSLDPIMAKDGRRQRLRKHIKNSLFFCNLVDVADVCVCDADLCDASARLGRKQDDVVGENECTESRTACTGIAVSERTVDTDELDAIARLDTVHEVVVRDNVDGTRQLTGRRALGHLLNRDGLMVSVDAVAVLCKKLDMLAFAFAMNSRGLQGCPLRPLWGIRWCSPHLLSWSDLGIRGSGTSACSRCSAHS